MIIQYLMSGTRSSDMAKVTLWRHGDYQYSIEVGGAEKTKYYFTDEYYDAVAKYKNVLAGTVSADKVIEENLPDTVPEITMNRQQLSKLNEFATHFSDVNKFRLSTQSDDTIQVSFNLTGD